MKIDTVNLNACRVKMTVKAEADETRPEYDAVVKQFMQKGRVPGFRVGKVPAEMVKRTFANEIREEVHTRLLRSLYFDALAQEKIKLVGLVNVEDVRFAPETGMTASFLIDVQPTFDVPDCTAIPVKPETPSVDEQEVDAQLQRLREAFATFETAKDDDVIQKGDLASIDFNGQIDGQPILEVAPEAKAIAEGKDFWMQVDEQRFLPQLVDALVGMKLNESKEVTVTFDEQAPEALKGRTAVYQLKVNVVRSRVLPDDAAMLKQTKMESVDALRNQVRESLLIGARQDEVRRQEAAVVEYLWRKAECDRPQSEVEEEINQTLARMADEAGQRGMTKEDMAQHRTEIIERATATAKRQLRLRYILGAIAKKAKIDVSDAEVEEWFAGAASDYRMNPSQLRAQVEKNGRMDALKRQICDQKALKRLVDGLK